MREQNRPTPYEIPPGAEARLPFHDREAALVELVAGYYQEVRELRLQRRRLKATLGKQEFTRRRRRGELYRLYYHLIH